MAGETKPWDQPDHMSIDHDALVFPKGIAEGPVASFAPPRADRAAPSMVSGTSPPCLHDSRGGGANDLRLVAKIRGANIRTRERLRRARVILASETSRRARAWTRSPAFGALRRKDRATSSSSGVRKSSSHFAPGSLPGTLDSARPVPGRHFEACAPALYRFAPASLAIMTRARGCRREPQANSVARMPSPPNHNVCRPRQNIIATPIKKMVLRITATIGFRRGAGSLSG